MPTDTDRFALLVESDRRYFEMAAKSMSIGAGEMAWIPDFVDFPAGVVVHRVNVDEMPAHPGKWVAALEVALREVGATLARVYMDSRGTTLDEELLSRGYEPRDEIGYVIEDVIDGGSGIELRPVDTEEAWTLKIALHEADAARPDGHPSSAPSWVSLEREKCEQGGMQPFLAWDGDAVVGAVCAVRVPHLLRVKNVVVHPGHRRRGVAQAMLARMSELAQAENLRGIGVFAVRDEPGDRLYRSLGMREVGVQVEWARPLHRPARSSAA
jgi:GNAT superfamily N-acetyltransferase